MHQVKSFKKGKKWKFCGDSLEKGQIVVDKNKFFKPLKYFILTKLQYKTSTKVQSCRTVFRQVTLYAGEPYEICCSLY